MHRRVVLLAVEQFARWVGPALLATVPASTMQERASPAGATGTAAFVALGDLEGGESWSEALAISDDGRVVVGRSHSAASSEAGFSWTRERGMVALPGL